MSQAFISSILWSWPIANTLFYLSSGFLIALSESGETVQRIYEYNKVYCRRECEWRAELKLPIFKKPEQKSQLTDNQTENLNNSRYVIL
jgi:hypothetical protein